MSDLIGVAGMFMRMDVEGDSRPPVLSGPALTAAVGIYCHRARPRFLSIPRCLTADEERLVSALDPEALARTSRGGDIMYLKVPAQLGTRTPMSTGERPPPPRILSPEAISEMMSRSLVLANGDPAEHAAVLAAVPLTTAVCVDLHGEWFGVRAREVAVLLARADVITVTEADWRRLPRLCLSGLRLGYAPLPVLVVKRGPEGVLIRSGGVEIALPPPLPPEMVRCDLGAGDLLVGCLAAELAEYGKEVDAHRVAKAYRLVSATVASLLAEPHPADFLAKLLGKCLS